ncbi:NAD(P)H dehydrogenase [Bacillus pseudomycoides]|uniref:NAD(P)H-dependent oxidoreductase n=1 Tax=Bacillus pseudomycoides TaxID=64104 RepID=A0AAJ3RD96_9BACI|nr:NAD(P)H-dependent oxidoreductase [Bacillus pseudomycoides]MBD5798021.1 NAD(P)H dehydrogenase [Bacillus pseudomycoides]MCR8860239.1 NAD(P)H-dependent oxidoreductase [Bacillus pseudomycoides]MDR4324402.1 NAD(P)H-dependent oxidoreductase [Bacillus pseudomycoides]MED1475771.1 NAD(P)H-dependent oxidoreductase [Bacillus pseudomycoides]MED1534463.1 NAD(P)H-dependent oxidoreductase [Bacillus pseudomycoides]
MKHLIVYAHPNPQSFNHAILETVKDELEEKGHEVRVRDLYELNFNPVLAASDFVSFSQGNTPADIKEEQEHITWADNITFIYPVSWAGLPAILKGYVDRVFSHGFAYAYGENGIETLLSSKKRLLLSTMGNTKEAYTASGMFDAMKKTTDAGIFEFTGIETLEHTFYTSVPSVDDGARKQYLEEVEEVVNRLLG